ncbi:MAG: transporter ATP-binding protein [Eubacterium sp.]|jgi:ATP-binding cassette subfamily B protein|nr:transporter ATP-binding protein [Eubacterium sp.]
MRKLFKYLKGSYFFVVAAPLMMLLEVMMDLQQPTLMSDIIDIGIANGDQQYIIATGIKMIIVAVIGFIGGAGCCILSSFAAMAMGTRLRQSMFDKIQTLSFSELDKLKTSSLITRLTNDVTQVQNTVLMMLRIMVRAPLLVIGGIIMALTISPGLTLIFAVSMPVLLFFVVLIVKKSFPLFLKMQEKIDRVNTVMRENLLGVKVVKAFNGHKKEEHRFKVANDDLVLWSTRAQKITVLLWPLLTLILNLSIIALLWFGGNMEIAGQLKSGDIMAFMNYLVQILMSLMMVVMLVINFSRAKVSADRVNEVLETETTIKNPEKPVDIKGYDVEFKNVSFGYNNSTDEYVLRNISFKANSGETIGIIGGTGSGKSSLVSLIPRLYDASEGAVMLGGINVKHLSLEGLRECVGVVMQDSILFSGTIEENLKWGDESSDERAMEEASRDAQAYDFIMAAGEGHKSTVEQRGKNFSGGQKQRLSIARTFLKNPKILILDDSTSAVDMVTEAKIQVALKDKKEDSIVFLIAQRISAIRDADKILVLDEGELSAIGTHDELIMTNEIYRSIAVSQLGEEVLSNVG